MSDKKSKTDRTKEDKDKNQDSSSGPGMIRGILDMMSKCCTGENSTFNCLDMMKAKKNQNYCRPERGKETAGSGKEKKNSCC